MTIATDVEIVLVSSGHQAMDHRIYHKEAISLAQYFPRVRVVAGHVAGTDMKQVPITALPLCRYRLERFAWRPLQCFLAARGQGKRVLILHDAELLFWAPLVKLLTGWQLIYDVHEDFPQLMLRRRGFPSAAPGHQCRHRLPRTLRCAGL